MRSPSFGPGLNLLTGETGAGKSILIDALALLLGGKASSDVVRHGAEKAVVGCVFEMTPGAAAVLEANGIDAEAGRDSAAAGDWGERQGKSVRQQSAGDGWRCCGSWRRSWRWCTRRARRWGRSTRRSSGCCWTVLAGSATERSLRRLRRGGRRRSGWRSCSPTSRTGCAWRTCGAFRARRSSRRDCGRG